MPKRIEMRGCVQDDAVILWADSENPAEFYSLYRGEPGDMQCFADFYDEEVARFCGKTLAAAADCEFIDYTENSACSK